MVWPTTSDVEKHKLFGKCVAPRQQLSADADNFVEHLSKLRINSEPSQVRLTGIICTIGPASCDPDTIEKMIANGMNIACVNMSRGQQDFHASAIKNIREASKSYSIKVNHKCPVAIAVTIKGPDIRTGCAAGGRCVQIMLKEREIIKLTPDLEYIDKGTSKILYVDYENIHKVVTVGDKICLDNDRISLTCVGVGESDIDCVIEKGGFLSSRRRVHLPGVPVDMPTLSKKGKAQLLFALEQNVEIVFVPLIRHGDAIKDIREVLGPSRKLKIIAKIENQQGVLNIDRIMYTFDGVLIARDSLGIEISPEQVVIVQKAIIAKTCKLGKPVICAVQMLDSMVKKPNPTRAEATDVANAVLDGADCLMLNHETSRGDYPLESISCMGHICREAEAALWRAEYASDLFYETELPVDACHAIVVTAADISVICGASAIVVVTSSFRSTQLLSKYKPNCPIIAVTRDVGAAKTAHLYRGIIPIVFKTRKIDNWNRDVEIRIYYGINFGRKQGFINPGDNVVTLFSSRQGLSLVYHSKISCLKMTFIRDCMHNLFRQTELAIHRSPLTLVQILNDIPGSVKRRLSLKHELIHGHLQHKYKLNPTSFVWLLRHFLGLLPLPLFPKYAAKRKYNWKYLSIQCKWNGIERNDELESVIFRCIARLPQANVLVIYSLMTFFKNILAKYKFSSRIYRKNIAALFEYFCSALFLRPYMPGFAFKDDNLYCPLLYYLLANWSQVTRQKLMGTIRNRITPCLASSSSLSTMKEENIFEDDDLDAESASSDEKEENSSMFTRLQSENLKQIFSSSAIKNEHSFEDKYTTTDNYKLSDCSCQTSWLLNQESQTKSTQKNYEEEEMEISSIGEKKIEAEEIVGQNNENYSEGANDTDEKIIISESSSFDKNSEADEYYDQPKNVKCTNSETAIYKKHKNSSKHSLKKKILKLSHSFSGVLGKVNNQLKSKQDNKTKSKTQKYSLLENNKNTKHQFSPNLNNFSTKFNPNNVKYKKLLTL